MARATTPLQARNSPLKSAKKASSNKNSLLRTVFKPTSNNDKQRSPFKFKPLRHSPYNRPDLAPKSKLQTIREESPEEEVVVEELRNRHSIRGQDDSANESFQRDFSMEEMSDAGEFGSSDDDSDFEGWDDETTLVAKFQEHAPDTASREKLADLAYQLEGPMQARADILKHYLAHTIAPAARRVKEVHNSLEQKVDVTFGVGVLSFDDSCKKIEQLSLRDEEDLKQGYTDTQRKVREYVKQLKEAYNQREQIWNEMHDAIQKSAMKNLASLSAIPSEIDEVALTIEKKSKDISKTGGKDNKAKLLRDLLAEM